jgi:hypothetical protein
MQFGATARWRDISRVLDACRVVGPPSAVSGLTLAVLRGWLDVEMPHRPQLVIPTSRRLSASTAASLRRVEHWGQLQILSGPYGVPVLGVLDGMITLAPDCDDGEFHTLLQSLAFSGDLDVRALMSRRRTGLPGSALITRVGERYLLGLDSPREVEVYRVLRAHQMPPDHLNVLVAGAGGLVVGPFDGYDEVGAAYEVDGVEVHGTDEQQDRDAAKNTRADRARVEVVRFVGSDITRRDPMLDGWWAARAAAEGRGLGASFSVIHLDGRGCPCGHRPG